MDIKNLVARFKSIRFSKKPAEAADVEKSAVAARVKKPAATADVKKIAVAAGVLAIAATGGAYYFLVYQPQMESEAAAAKAPVAKKPQPAPPPPAAKPVIAQPAAPVPSVPVVVPEKQPSVVAQAPVVPVPVPEMSAKPVKHEPVAKTLKSKKRKAAAKSKQVDKPEQVATSEQKVKLESKLDVQGASQPASLQPQDVLLKPAYPPVEPAPVPVAVETAPVAPVEPAPVPVPSVITPKYNDIMTAVLRGDREAAKELLELGWWADKPSADGITPLMAAVMNRDTQMVQLLLEYRAEPTAQALKLAQKNNDTATATLLEQKGAH